MIERFLLASVALLLTVLPSSAQGRYRVEWTVNGPVWHEVGPKQKYGAPKPSNKPSNQLFWGSGPKSKAVAGADPDEDDDTRPQKKKPSLAKGPPVLQGGPKPAINPVAPPTVAFPNDYGTGTIVIDTAGRALYYVLSSSSAYRYPISVGREGFTWTGTEAISRKVSWPDWRPPAEMRQRKPELPELMTGGLYNPLGAMALYLGNTLYRIHGTNDGKTIGQAASSGCFRMHNGHVMHLAGIAGVGTKVRVMSSLPKSKTKAADAAAGQTKLAAQSGQ